MEMCYDGTLVMPSSYAVMSEEEMTYVEGGRIFTVIASPSTVRSICRAGAAFLGALIGEVMGGPIIAKLISGILMTVIFDFIMDVCGYKYPSIYKSWNACYLPTFTLDLNKYV